MLVITAQPVLELFAALVLGHFDGEMRAHQPDASSHEVVDDLQAVLLDEGMTCPAIGVEEDTVGTLERLFAIGPAVAIVPDLQSWNSRQTFVEQKNTGVELMLHRPVAWPAGQHDQFLAWSVGKDRWRRHHPNGSSGGAQEGATRKSEIRVHNQGSLD